MVIYEAVQKSYLGGWFGSSVDKKNEEGIMEALLSIMFVYVCVMCIKLWLP